MKIAVSEGSAWIGTYVYLDGVKLERCTEADDAAGYAIVDTGMPFREGEPQTLHGKVEFRFVNDRYRAMAEAEQSCSS